MHRHRPWSETDGSCPGICPTAWTRKQTVRDAGWELRSTSNQCELRIQLRAVRQATQALSNKAERTSRLLHFCCTFLESGLCKPGSAFWLLGRAMLATYLSGTTGAAGCRTASQETYVPDIPRVPTVVQKGNLQLKKRQATVFGRQDAGQPWSAAP